MASGTAGPETRTPVPPSAEVVEYGQFIESQLRKTRTQVKWVEVSAGLMTLAAGILGYLFLVAIVDSWIVSAGFGRAGRWLCLFGLLAGGAAYFARAVLPLCLRRVNPVYAAYTIERSRPSLKNSLINFLLLRSERAQLPTVIYNAVEERAAADLTHVEVEGTIDRSRLVKLAYLLLAIVVVAGGYKLLSPRDPLQSVGRVIFPWTDVARPSRVTIEDITPGDVTAFYGDHIGVSAAIDGIDEGEPVTLLYTTADGQTVDRPIEMRQPEGNYRHAAALPVESDGLLQDVEYVVAAGDARSRPFRVTVRPAPAIVVRSVELEYPPYTGLSNLTQTRGDIKALEGTTVTVRAEANEAIATAHIDLNCDGLKDERMIVDGQRASVTFPLKLNDDFTPEHTKYVLRFTNEAGHENPEPIQYAIDVIRDLPPEVSLTEPQTEEVELPRNAALNVGVAARDPDFALSRVAVAAEVAGKKLSEDALFAEIRPGDFAGQYVFDASRHNLQPGDVVEYWAIAQDNKLPTGNESLSQRQRIRIVDSLPDDKAQQQRERAEQEREERQENPPQDQNDHQPRDQQRPDRPQDEQPQNTEDEQQPDGEQGDQPQDEQQPADEGQAGERQPRDERQPNEEGEAGEERQPGENADSEQQEEGEPQEGQQPGDQQQGDQQQGTGETPRDGQSQPGEQSAEGQSGEGQQGEQTGEGQPGEGQSGEQGTSEQAADGQQSGEERGQSREAAQRGANDSAGQQDTRRRDQPINPETNPGEAFEEVLKHRDEQEQAGEGQSGERQAQGENQPGAEQQPGAEEGAQQQPEPQPGAQRQPGAEDQPGGEEQHSGENQPGAEQQPGEQQAEGQQPADDAQRGEQAGEPMEGDGTGERQESDPAQQGNQPGGEGQSGETEQSAPDAETPGDQPGQPMPGENPGDEAGAEEKQPLDDEPGDANPFDQLPEGQGDSARGTPQETEQQPGEQPEGSEQQGGQPDREFGQSGEGDGGKQQQPGPGESRQPKPKPKQPGQQQGESPDDTDAPAQSDQESESDSQGGAQGDRAGGGQEGGGQSADQPGTGGPGDNTAAEEGGSNAPGQGNGDASSEAGQRAASDRPTGESDDAGQPGQGTRQRQGGDQPGAARSPSGEQAEGEQSEDRSGDRPEGEPSGQPGQPGQQNPDNSGAPGANPPDGGQAGGHGGANDPHVDPSTSNPQPTDLPGAKDPNLDYANRATDLALNHLKDELAKDEPDQELLDRLGWTRDDMEKFVRRWEALKRQAAEVGADSQAAREKLDDELRSLGLRPRSTSLRGDDLAKENERTTVGESRRSEPPAEYAEQYRAYTEGRAKADRGDD